jgi:aminomethyltransferase
VEELVSFNKGCYAGQEVVEMATARGRPNRQLVKFSVPGREVTAGSKLSTDNSKAAAGEVTSSVYLPQDNRSLILALVKTSELEKPLFSEGTKLSAL